ncbi:MAG: hypothetical protein ACLFVE_16195 [Chitinispirillaceae bacterium]
MLKISGIISAVLVCGSFFLLSAQSKSAIEFYDTTGTDPASKVGWTGDASNGHFFIKTPGESGPVKIENGNLIVDGTVTGVKIEGDGSGLTNLPVSSGSDGVGVSEAFIKSDSLFIVLTDEDTLNAGKVKADSVHSHDVSSVDFGAGTTGQVWKINSEGQPEWGTDLQGEDGATTIAGIEGLSDTLTAHGNGLGSKADTSDIRKINDSLSSKVSLDQSKSITSGMIEDGAVGSDELKTGSVTDDHISSDAGISYSKISGGPVNSGWVDNGSNIGLQIPGDSVGIGLSSPESKLHLRGGMKVDSGSISIQTYENGMGDDYASLSNTKLSLGVNGVHRMSGIEGGKAYFVKSATSRTEIDGGNVHIDGSSSSTRISAGSIKLRAFSGKDSTMLSSSGISTSGTVSASNIMVDGTSLDVPDYVFEESYRLRSLDEVKSFITQHKHLPDIPSAEEINDGRMDMVKMNLDLLKKVEELTLYILEQNNKSLEQDEKITKLQSEIEELRNGK